MRPGRCWILPFALAAAISACSQMPHQRVEGLPPLQVSEHTVAPEEIFKYCSDAMAWWHWVLLALPVACARIDFDQRTCDIFVASDSPSEIIEHERLHCQGYDHGGRIQKAVDAWLRSKT